jgi:hypothetical protein
MAQLAPTPTASGFERPVRAKAHRALRSRSMGFLHLPMTASLYLIIAALLSMSIGLLGFASALLNTPPASLMGR